jgi:DNA-binding transcriptional MerR regulator
LTLKLLEAVYSQTKIVISQTYKEHEWMIRIGIFSRISQVPVSTLRYYDAVGLIKAAHTDDFTGYRYYTIDQLPQLHRILALKEMGLSLEEIQKMWEKDLPIVEIRGMLRLKQAELRQHLQEESERLNRLENWLHQFEEEDSMPQYEVIMKKVEPVSVFSIRDVIPDYPDQGALWDELDAYLEQHRIQIQPPGVTVYHQEEPEIEVEVCLQAKDPGATARAPHGRVQFRELTGIESAASTIHSGPLKDIGDGYKALISWIERQNYRIVGPVREVYLRGPKAHSQTDPDVIVELQAPVAKVS